MNPKNYTSLATSKRLKELGIVQKSDVCYSTIYSDSPLLTCFNYTSSLAMKCSAFNASELGAMFGLSTKATEWLRTQTNSRTITSCWQPDQLAEYLIMWLTGFASHYEQESIEANNERYAKYLEQ